MNRIECVGFFVEKFYACGAVAGLIEGLCSMRVAQENSDDRDQNKKAGDRDGQTAGRHLERPEIVFGASRISQGQGWSGDVLRGLSAVGMCARLS